MKREVVIPPFMTIMMKGVVKLMAHSKCMNVFDKPIMGYWTTLPQPDLMMS